MKESHQRGATHALVPLVASFALAISGCSEQSNQSLTECVLTQPSLVGAVSINGYAGNPQGGVLFETLRPYGVTVSAFNKKYEGTAATAKTIRAQLDDQRPLNESSIIAFCFTIANRDDVNAKGRMWAYETPTHGKFGTTAITREAKVPSYFKKLKKAYPNATVFKINDPAQTELAPLEYPR